MRVWSVLSLERSQVLKHFLQRKELFKKILFTDKKVFTMEEKFNCQNGKSVHSILMRGQRRDHCPSFIMVLWVLWNDVTPIHFWNPRVKTIAKVNVETVLDPIVQPRLKCYSSRKTGSCVMIRASCVWKNMSNLNRCVIRSFVTSGSPIWH